MGPRSERHERLRAALLPVSLLVAALALAVACERAGQERAAAPSAGGGALAARREAAARRGIEWLLAQRAAMEPEWAYSVFSYLAPIAPDAALAAACRESAAAAARTPFAALPASLSDPALLELATLRSVVAELLRRQRVGEPWREPARELEALLRAHAGLWQDVPPAQQAVLVYGLSELGIESGWTLEDTVRLLRQRWRRNRPERMLGHAPYLFGLTHVLYAASGYFARYPDAKAFAPEGARLRQALRHYLSGPPPQERYFLDVQGEILVGLKLLRTPEDDAMREMAERLLALQNPDGSWGEDFGNHRFHATGVAVQALLDYPDEFPGR